MLCPGVRRLSKCHSAQPPCISPTSEGRLEISQFNSTVFQGFLKGTRIHSAANTGVTRWALLFPLACVIIQGGHTVISKMSATVVSPEAISCYRWAVAVAVLTPFMARSCVREWPAIRRHLGRLAILSFMGLVVYQALVYVAAQSATATNIAIIGALAPLVSVGWAALLLRYRPGPVVLLGCALSLIGILELVHKGSPLAVFSHAPDLSDSLVLVGVGFYSLYGVLVRRWKLPIPAQPMFYAQALLALLITIPGPLIGTATPITSANAWIVLAAGVAGSAAAPFLWMKAMQTVGPVTSGLFTNLSPLITTVIAIAYLGEALEAYHIIGAALIIGGVMLAQTETLRQAT